MSENPQHPSNPQHGSGPYADFDDVATEYHPGGYGNSPTGPPSELYGSAAPVAPPRAEPPRAEPTRVPVVSARATVGGAPPRLTGTVYGDRATPPPLPAPPSEPGRRPPALLAGRHTAPSAHLAQLVLPNGQAGLLLGRDQHGAPVAIRPFQRDGVRIALLGGLWAARVLVFRSLALGARVVVHTARPVDWRGLGRWAVGLDDRLMVLESDQPVMVAATAANPLLTVHDFPLSAARARDSGPQGNLAAAGRGPWRADLTVLSQVNAAGFMAVEQADLVLAQRLSAHEAYSAQSVRRFADSTVDMLQRLGDDMIGVIGDGDDGYAWLAPTRWELEAFGQPQV